MESKKRLCIFCGSSSGQNPAYIEMVKQLAKLMHNYNIDLVYGGSNIGLMGAMANEVLALGGEAYGVIPADFRKLEIDEIEHSGLTHLYRVASMHERKAKMYELSDAFLAIPGGMGTLDEICEIVTWAQLRFHNKTCALFNFRGFFNHFINHLDQSREEGFISEENRKLLTHFDTWEEIEKFLSDINKQ